MVSSVPDNLKSHSDTTPKFIHFSHKNAKIILKQKLFAQIKYSDESGLWIKKP